jgi:hypothetical protein
MYNNRLSNFSILTFGFAILIYLVFRAILIPMTDDEYMSYLYFVRQDVWSIITYKSTIMRANNHILNTLFIKLSIAIFGVYDWAFRIHSVLSFIVCYYFTYKILAFFTKSNFRIFLYLLIFFLNPYLLDFFALARGYAMCIAFWCGATYYFFQYNDKKTIKNLTYHLVFLFLSIWSNFSVLYFFPLFGILFLYQWYENRKSFFALKHFLIFSIGYIIIVGIVAIPIFLAIKSNETHGGLRSLFQDSMMSYVDSFINTNARMNRFLRFNEQWSWEEICAIIIISSWFVMQFISIRINKNTKIQYLHWAMLFFFFGTSIIVEVLFRVLKAPYPLARTTLLYSFPFYFCFIIAYEKIASKYKSIAVLMALILLFQTWNFYWSFTMENTKEWWREGDSKRVLAYLKEIKKGENEVSLAADSWQYFSLVFYGDTQYKGIIKVNWRPLDGNEKDDYLFAGIEYKQNVPNRYKIIKEFTHGILFKCEPCE